MSSSDAALVVTDVCAGYGSMEVVRGISLIVGPGEIVALIGRNGAGKTTTLLALGGLRYGRWKGSVRHGSTDLSRLSAAQIFRLPVLRHIVDSAPTRPRWISVRARSA